MHSYFFIFCLSIPPREYSGHFFSDDSIEVIKNEKRYRFDKNFNLIDVEEKETVNEKDNIFYSCKIYPQNDHIEVVTTLTSAESVSVFFPKNEIPISSYASGQYYVANSKLDKIDKYYFFYNVHGYFDKYKFLRNEVIESNLFGTVNCAIIEYKGNTKATLWIDRNRNLILQKEENLSDKYMLRIELDSVINYE